MSNDAYPKITSSPVGDPEVQLSCVSNIFIRMMHFKHAGDIEHGHCHPFDHVSMLARGSVKVTVNNVTKEFTAPHMIFIKKDMEHELVAMEDDTTVMCIHAIRDGEAVEDIIDPESTIIPAGSEGIEFMEKAELFKYISHPNNNA